jgi:hypothetical protein
MCFCGLEFSELNEKKKPVPAMGSGFFYLLAN